MGSEARKLQRRQQRASKKDRTAAAVSELGGYVKGYERGALDGYMACLEDLKAGNVVDRVAAQIIAVHNDPHEQSLYVLDKVQKALRPRSPEALQLGIQQLTAKHLQERGLLPTFDGEVDGGPGGPGTAK